MTITTQKSTESRMDRVRFRMARLTRRYFTVFNIGVVLLILSISSGFYGYFHTHPVFSWDQLIEDLYANVSTEFFSVAITILIIDSLNQRRQREEEKQRLIRQMGSTERGLALNAVEELKVLGAVKDGSLIGANFEEANLHGVRLGRAIMNNTRMDFSDFSQAHLYFADLQHADMSGIDFRGAVLTGANLRNADLVAAHLEGALLSEADLTHAKLDQAKFDETTQLPDQTTWHPTVDLSRFTNPNHPNYWRSQMQESPAFVGGRRGN